MTTTHQSRQSIDSAVDPSSRSRCIDRSRRKTAQPALNPVSLKCVGAIRGSTEKQRLTIPTQGTAIGHFAELKGFEHVADFIDSGTCGKTAWLERDNVKEMIRFMADNAIQHIVYTRLDRAFRSTADALLTITECANHGVKIHFCEQDLDFTTAMGRAMLTVIALFAELETDLRLQRQLETVSIMRQSGFKAGRNVPYGWNKVPSATRKTRATRKWTRTINGQTEKTDTAREDEALGVGADTALDLVPNREQQDVLAEILKRSGEGQSDAHISKVLNLAAIPTQQGKRWFPATVYSVRSFARVADRKEYEPV